MKRIWIVLGILLGVAVIAAAGYFGFRSSRPEVTETPNAPDTVAVSRCDVSQSVTAPGTVVNRQETAVRVPVTARLDEVLVRPGETVAAGDVIAELSRLDIDLAIAQAQLDLANAQAALDEARQERAGMNVSRASDLTRENAELRYSMALLMLAEAQQMYDAVANLPSSDPDRLMATDALLAAQRERDQALALLNWYSGHPSDQALLEADAELALAEARLARAQDALESLQQAFALDDETAGLRAPRGGVILEVKAGAGETVNAGAELLVLAAPAEVEVRVTVLEEDFPYVAVGQPAEIYFDALPEEAVTGTISRILPRRASGDRPLYYVYIALDRVPGHLVEGMTADSAILIAQRPQVLCLPRALVRASSGSTAAVSVWNGLTSETRQIEVGLRGDVYVEILSGLDEGEQVVSR
jgi:RND family efflux transporter MFP subunit